MLEVGVFATASCGLLLEVKQQNCFRKQPYDESESVPVVSYLEPDVSNFPEAEAEAVAAIAGAAAVGPLWTPLEKFDDVGDEHRLPFNSFRGELFRWVGIGGGGAGGA